jgi:hypothetical protein
MGAGVDAGMKSGSYFNNRSIPLEVIYMKIKRIFITSFLVLSTIISAAGFGYGTARAVFAMADETVNIPDPTLQVAIRETLDIHGRDIRASDMASITRLDITYNPGGLAGGIPQSPISDLTGLEYCINVEEIRLVGDQIKDLSPLSKLTRLQSLLLAENSIRDVSPLAGLSNLETLIIDGNDISDISALANLTNLKNLGIQRNHISDISPLTKLYRLEILSLEENQILDISPLLENKGFTDIPTKYYRKKLGLSANPLNTDSIDTYIPQLKNYGIKVIY